MAHQSEPTPIKPKSFERKVPFIIKPVENPIYEILGFFAVGALAGGSMGSYITYRKSSPIVAGSAAQSAVWRGAIHDLVSTALWVGGAGGLYAVGNHLSILFRGKSDVTTPYYGGAACGFVLARYRDFNLTNTLITVATLSIVARLMEGRRYDPNQVDHIPHLASIQEEKVKMAYKHVLEKADQENYKRTREYEDAIIEKVREKL